MDKYLEIKWQGRAGQGVVTSASLLAELLARERKHVQAFPEFIPLKQRPSILAFNRISDSSIKHHAVVNRAGVMVLMDPRQLLMPNVKQSLRDDASFIINTSYAPDFIKEKLNLTEANAIYTLDADNIASEEAGLRHPGIPLMAVLVHILKLIPADAFKNHIKELLTQRLSPELTAANLKTIDRAVAEVKTHES